MFGLFGTKGRIGTLFRIYKAAKNKFPSATKRQLLEIVAEELILPGKSTQIRNLGMSGKQYLDGVFESGPLDVDELIYHIVTLEFPKKYLQKIDVEKIFEQKEKGTMSPREELKKMIIEQHKKFLDESF